MISKKILLPIFTVAVIGGASMLGAGEVHAQTNANPLTNLVQMIAQKFGLNQTQVQSVVDEYRSQKQQQMRGSSNEREQSRLGALVTQGKITEAQKQAITNKLAELKTKYDPAKNMTMEERKAQMEAMRTEAKTWAESQNIDPTYVMPGGLGRGMYGKFGRQGAVPTP